MKSRLIKKIRCPSGTHEDTTPSCALYADGSGYCFSCQSFFKKLAEPEAVPEVKPEDLIEKLSYIDSLPKDTIRGLLLPYDNMGYYIVWPDRSYYKLRKWATNGPQDRYLSPRGVAKTPFYIPPSILTESLIIVEGEINALSLNKAKVNYGIFSPGSTTNFSVNYLEKYLRKLTHYTKILILVDDEYVSLQAALTVKDFLQHTCPNVLIHLMNIDCNDILVTHGEEALKKEIDNLEMS